MNSTFNGRRQPPLTMPPSRLQPGSPRQLATPQQGARPAASLPPSLPASASNILQRKATGLPLLPPPFRPNPSPQLPQAKAVRGKAFEAPRLVQSRSAVFPPALPALPVRSGAIQRSAPSEESKTEASIGSRVRGENSASRFKSARLGAKAATARKASSAPYVPTPRKRDLWNETTRPSFLETTWDGLWAEAGRHEGKGGVRQYPCVKCGKQCLRRKDTGKKKATADDATIDHATNWKEYILTKGAPVEDGEDAGRVTAIGAKNAYNDTDNLSLMCRSCNSAKNGPKNVFD